MLMLITPSIARPVQQNTTMDAVLSEPVKDEETECSLCASSLPAEVLDAQDYLNSIDMSKVQNYLDNTDISLIKQDIEQFERKGILPEGASAILLENIDEITTSIELSPDASGQPEPLLFPKPYCDALASLILLLVIAYYSNPGVDQLYVPGWLVIIGTYFEVTCGDWYPAN